MWENYVSKVCINTQILFKREASIHCPGCLVPANVTSNLITRALESWISKLLSQHTNTDGTTDDAICRCRPGNTKLTPVSTSHMSDASTPSFTMYTHFFQQIGFKWDGDCCKAGFIYKWTSEDYLHEDSLQSWSHPSVLMPRPSAHSLTVVCQLGKCPTRPAGARAGAGGATSQSPEVGLNTVITRENITWEWGHGEKLFEWSMQTINEGGSVASK